MIKPISIEQQCFDTPPLSKVKSLIRASIFLGLATLMSGISVSCTTIPERKTVPPENRNAEAQKLFDNFKAYISFIQSNHITPLDMKVLAKVARAAMYRADPSVKVVNSRFSSEPFNDLQEDYFYLMANNPKLVPGELIVGAIRGIFELLKPNLKIIMSETGDTLTAGVGVSLQQINSELVISSLIQESSSQRLNLERGDRLLKIDDQDLHEQPLEEVIQMLRGLPGTTAHLTIERSGKLIEVTAIREIIKYAPIKSSLYAKGLGYIRIAQFVHTSQALLEKEVSVLESANGEALKGLIIDLRDNGGGELDAVVAVADYFLDNGLILFTRGQAKESNRRFLASSNDKALPAGVKLVILINGQTAAGAEMLAASLQDHHRAIIIGTTSQGFNTVSTVYPMGAFRYELVTAEMIRPSGKPLNKLGVVPDTCVRNKELVSLNPEQYQSPEEIWNACPSETQLHKNEGDDIALQAAVNALREK